MIKHTLRRWPWAYVKLQRAYYATLYASERYVLGTRLHEVLWRWRRFEELAIRSSPHPHRAFLVERLRRFEPLGSILEVGCNAAPNLLVLGRAFPEAQLHGIDINRQAIETAKTVLAREGVRHAAVNVGRADDLGRFGDKTFDVALTDATLMYVGPDKITRAIAELTRVARRGVILNEWHLFDGSSTGQRAFWYDAHWVHDYEALLGGQAVVEKLRIERLPHGMWGKGGWEEYGAVVEAELRQGAKC